MSATDKPAQQRNAESERELSAAGEPDSREAPADERAAEDGGEVQDGPPRELRPEDQERVDAFLKRGVNSVERKPFRPVLLMIMLIVVVAGLSFLAQGIARMAGVY